MNVEVIVMSCNRSPAYLSETLRSYHETGGYDQGWPLPKVSMTPLSELAKIKPEFVALERPENIARAKREGLSTDFDLSAYRRISANFAAAHGRLEHPGHYFLLLEDDIRFAKGWIEKLEKVTFMISAGYGERWVLSLYHGKPATNKIALPDANFTKAKYYEGGGEATLFSPEVVSEFSPEMYRHCFEDFPVFCAERNISMLTTLPSLVQHIGREGGASGFFDDSPDFQENV
jgi:hypothetical protein